MPSGVQQTSIRQNKYLIWNLKSKKYIYGIKNKEACSTNSLMTLIGRTLKDKKYISSLPMHFSTLTAHEHIGTFSNSYTKMKHQSICLS